jgi:ADP-heptose:LPS heptosyltransferase
MPRSVVIVNFTRLGDLLQSGPLLRAAHRRYPAHEVTLVVLKSFADVARRLPGVDHIVEFDLDHFVGELDARRGRNATAMTLVHELLVDQRLSRPDLVINLSHTPQSAILCGAMHPQQSVGLVQTGRGDASCTDPWLIYALSIIRNRTRNSVHLVDVYRYVFGANASAPRLEFVLSDADRDRAAKLVATHGDAARRRYVVLIPGASKPERRWPVASYAALAQRLQRASLASLIVGSAREQEFGAEIERASGGVAKSICGQTDVATLAGVLAGACVVVGNDTGPLHLATAVGTPVVGLYIGPAAMKDTGPYLDGGIALEPDLPRTPCDYHADCGHCGCAQAIAVDTVATAVLEPSQLVHVRGVRAWRARLHEHWGFQAELLNRPRTQPDAQSQAFFRLFWIGLLSREHGVVATVPADEWRAVATALVGIAERAVASLQLAGSEWLTELAALSNSEPRARSIVSYFEVAWKCLPRESAARLLPAYEQYVDCLLRAAQLLAGNSNTNAARPTPAIHA